MVRGWVLAALLPSVAAFSVYSPRGPCWTPRTKAHQPLSPSMRMNVPSWEEIQLKLPKEEEAAKPLLHLYADNNAWCPHCNTVKMALALKGIPYSESTTEIGSRSQRNTQFLEDFPEGTVPSIKVFKSGHKVTGAKYKDWDSYDVLLALETLEDFKDFKCLLPEHEREQVYAIFDELRAVKFTDPYPDCIHFGLPYFPPADKEAEAAKRESAMRQLSTVDEILGRTAGSPFVLDSGISVIDCELAPSIERAQAQFPLRFGIDPLDTSNFPNIAKWWDALNQVEEYTASVKGDTYSWTAVYGRYCTLLKTSSVYWELDEEPEVAARAKSSEILANEFHLDPMDFSQTERELAVKKLLTNRKAVVKDALNSNSDSQSYLKRVKTGGEEEVDRALRRAAAMLLLDEQQGCLTEGVTEVEAFAAELVAARVCAPRDMNGFSASALRRALGKVVLASETHEGQLIEQTSELNSGAVIP